MRRIITAISAVALALSLAALASPASAAVPGFDSSYAGESAFLAVNQGDTGTFTVFFLNTGASTWTKGTSTQVDLAACLDDKVTCNAQDATESDFNPGTWLGAARYTTATQSSVSPGQVGTFTYSVKVPATKAAATYHFNGALVISSTGQDVHNEGYFQDVTVQTAPPPASAVTPAFATNVDNFGPTLVTVTFTGVPAGPASVTTIPSENVALTGFSQFSFRDTNADKRADGVCSGAGGVSITSVNGVAQSGSSCAFQFTVPATGTVTVNIQSSTANGRIRLVLWQDKDQNGQIQLTSAGAADGTKAIYDSATDGLMLVSGTEFFFPAEAAFGTRVGDSPTANTNCVAVIRHDDVNKVFSTATAAFKYDSNDSFRIGTALSTQSAFQSSLIAATDGSGSKVSLTYNSDPSGVSEFNICNSAGAEAPASVSAIVGNFDAGATANDVRITFVAPTTNTLTTAYGIQRATAASTATTCDASSGTYSTVGSLSVNAGDTGTFTDFNLADGKYCYRVRVVNPVTTAESFGYSNVATVPGTTSTVGPKSTEMILTANSGLVGTMDSGDKFTVKFDIAVQVPSGALLRFTDGDCGTNGGSQTTPPTCSGANSQTVADVICGTNATCSLDSTKKILTVTLTGDPVVRTVGSVTGAQYPAWVTDTSGITAESNGVLWDLTGSTDRAVGPSLGQ